MKALLLITLFVFSAHAAKEKPAVLHEARPIVEATVKLLNSKTGIVGRKNVAELERRLTNAEDKAYLKSLVGQNLLPKKHKALDMYDAIVITNENKAVLSLRVISVNPLTFESGEGKTIQVDQNHRSRTDGGSARTAAPLSAWIASIVVPSAHAGPDETLSELPRRISFLASLMAEQSAVKLEAGTDGFSPYINRLDHLFAQFAMDAQVRCQGDKADILIRKGELSTHITGYSSAQAECSKGPSDHKIFFSHQISIPKDRDSKIWGRSDALDSCLSSAKDPEEGLIRLSGYRQIALEKILKRFQQKLGLSPEWKKEARDFPGLLLVEKGDCVARFDKNSDLSPQRMKNLAQRLEAFCAEGSVTDLRDKIKNFDERRQARNEMIDSLHGNTFTLVQAARALGACCADSTCRARASEKAGMELEEDSDSGTHDAR